MEVVLGIPFLSLSGADMGFAEQLVCWSYTMQRPCLLAATRRVEFVDKRGFPVAAVDQVYELVSGRACADAEPHHSPQEFKGQDRKRAHRVRFPRS